MLPPEFEALQAETERLIELAEALGPIDWIRPTRCPPLDMRTLLAHVLSSYTALERVAVEAPVAGEPDQDHLTWWDYDPKEMGAWVLRQVVGQPWYCKGSPLHGPSPHQLGVPSPWHGGDSRWKTRFAVLLRHDPAERVRHDARGAGVPPRNGPSARPWTGA